MSKGRLYKLYIFDLDGTLYRGEEAIPFAAESVATLEAAGAKIAYVTNNATRTRDYLTARLRRMGFAANPNQIESSASLAADYCLEQGLGPVGLIGETGLCESMKDLGIRFYGPDEEWPDQLAAVFVGLFRDMRYLHIDKAMQAISDGARFIGTNPDLTFPLENGRFSPGAGAGIAAIQACTGKEPLILGKPSPLLPQQALKRAGVEAKDALMVGDRLNTDIESGKRAGLDTWLVMTGVEHEAPAGQPFSEDLRGLPGLE